jgi:hypothetical protein
MTLEVFVMNEYQIFAFIVLPVVVAILGSIFAWAARRFIPWTWYAPFLEAGMTIDYWLAVPLIGIGLTVPFWVWMLWATRKRRTSRWMISHDLGSGNLVDYLAWLLRSIRRVRWPLAVSAGLIHDKAQADLPWPSERVVCARCQGRTPAKWRPDRTAVGGHQIVCQERDGDGTVRPPLL